MAEQAIAFVAEDEKEQAERLRAALGSDAPRLALDVSTFAYDVGVFALGALGVTLMALSNFLVGGAMTLAAPIVAWALRGRVDRQVKERAIEEAPKVVREAADKLAEGFDARIAEVGERLVTFIAQANREMTRSIAEVVAQARAARAEGEDQRGKLERDAGQALARLGDVEARLSNLGRRIKG